CPLSPRSSLFPYTTLFRSGLFLLVVIIFVPLYLLPTVGGFKGISAAINVKQISGHLIPNFQTKTLLDIFFLTVGWGLGYFGQPQDRKSTRLNSSHSQISYA